VATFLDFAHLGATGAEGLAPDCRWPLTSRGYEANSWTRAKRVSQIDLDALADIGIREMLAHPVAVGWIRQTPPELGQLVLRPRVLNVGEQLPALADQMQPPA
jgi:hypothetical protein